MIETFRDYQEALDYLNGKRERPIGYATRLYHWDDRVFVFHHGSEILSLRNDGQVTFSCGGWGSKSTLERLDALSRRLGLRLRFHIRQGRPIVVPVPHTHSVRHEGELEPAGVYRVAREVTKDGEEVIALRSKVHGEMLFKL